jgi:hypothetical protein
MSVIPVHPRVQAVFAAVVLSLIPVLSPAYAQAQPAPLPVVVTADTAHASMGGRVRLRFSGLTAASRDHLVLFLNHRAMKGVYGVPIDSQTVEFRLRRSDAGRDSWASVLGPPGWSRTLNLSAGPEAGVEFASKDPRRHAALNLTIIPVWRFLGGLLVWLVGLYCLVRWSRKGLLRDSVPPAGSGAPGAPAAPGDPGRPDLQPYSLARSQMAFWFVLVATAFLLIWVITWDYRGVVTEQAVWLMGIGSLTALGARLVEALKQGRKAEAAVRGTLKTERARIAADATRAGLAPDTEDELRMALARTDAQLAALSPAPAPETPPQRRFWKDILYENGVVALHRVQIVFWTLTLGAVFVVEVWNTLELPQFDATLLALLGVSGGAYVFMKVQENQT